MDTFDKKTFATLLFSVFATITGVGIVVPLLPVYAHDLGASGLYIGLIFGAFSLSRTVFLPYFGRLSDRKGRKRIIVPGLLTYAAISLAFVFARDVTALIVIRFFQGIGSAMLMPVIQAYVADIAPVGRVGRTMGLHSAFVLFGLSLGPLLGGLVKDNFSLQAAFVCMGLLALVGLTLCLAFLPPTHSERVHAFKQKKPISWWVLVKDRTLAALFAFRFSYVVCIGIIWGFLPLYADQKLSVSSSSIGFLIMLGVLVSGTTNGPMGVLADRINRKVMVIVGGLLACYAIFSLGAADKYGEMVLASVLFGLGGGVCMPPLMTMAAMKGEERGAMGSVMAVMTVAHSLGMLTGALLGGVMMDVFHLGLVFSTGAIVIAVGLLLFVAGTYPAKRSLDAPAESR